MKILFFGDIMGQPGREALVKILPELKKQHEPDLTIANGENLAHGAGVTEVTMKEIMGAGVDFVTGGNHIFMGGGRESITLLENKKWPLIRPANWSSKAVGDGFRIISIRTKKVLVINLVGCLFMKQQHNSPFESADEILDDYELIGRGGKRAEKVDAIVVDWHAEASSEKRALGWYLDGRVSAVLGTHTHVATADAQILTKGTAYISDVGMVGVKNSILGLNKENVVNGYLTQMPQAFQMAEGDVDVNYVLLETDDVSGLAKNIERKQEIVLG